MARGCATVLTSNAPDGRDFTDSLDVNENTSDAGVLLLHEMASTGRVIRRLSGCFGDFKRHRELRQLSMPDVDNVLSMVIGAAPTQNPVQRISPTMLN